MKRITKILTLLSAFTIFLLPVDNLLAERHPQSELFVSKGEPPKVADPEPLPNVEDTEGMELENLRKERENLEEERKALEKEKESMVAEDEEDSSDTSPKNRTLTRLRLDDRPIGTWHKGANTILKEVKAIVRNVGSVKATRVKVTAYAPGGKAFELEGPTTLEKNERGEYFAAPAYTVTIAGNIEVKMTCGNCRR